MSAAPIRLSVLDQSPVIYGHSARDAIAATVDLAQLTDALGYTRYWCAEHHGLRGVSNPAPEVMIARVASATKHLRVGSGGHGRGRDEEGEDRRHGTFGGHGVADLHGRLRGGAGAWGRAAVKCLSTVVRSGIRNVLMAERAVCQGIARRAGTGPWRVAGPHRTVRIQVSGR
jgi:hypothetical protein